MSNNNLIGGGQNLLLLRRRMMMQRVTSVTIYEYIYRVAYTATDPPVNMKFPTEFDSFEGTFIQNTLTGGGNIWGNGSNGGIPEKQLYLTLYAISSVPTYLYNIRNSWAWKTFGEATIGEHSFGISDNKMYLDDHISSVITVISELSIFCLRASTSTGIKYKKQKYYLNGELVAELCPASKDGVYGIYDKITKEFTACPGWECGN